MKTVSSVRRDVEKFRWKNKKKSYEGNLQDLKSLYWHTVAHEILGDKKLALNKPVDYNPLIHKISKSYLGIFFWPHKLYHALIKRFEGLHISGLKEEKELWEDWKKETMQIRLDAIHEIASSVLHGVGRERFMVENPQVGDLPFNWRAYDTEYQSKTESISGYLSKHLKPGTFYFKDHDSPEISFRYDLNKQFINRLHREANKLAQTVILYKVFTDMEKMSKRKYENEGNTQKIERPLQTVVAYKKMELKDAIEDLFRINPGFKKLTLSIIKHHIIVKYRDIDGKKFKNNSVDNALRKEGYKN